MHINQTEKIAMKKKIKTKIVIWN